MKTGVSFDENEVIRIKRDGLTHSWVIAAGGCWLPLPWKDTADAVSVVLWIKERAGRAVAVRIEP